MLRISRQLLGLVFVSVLVMGLINVQVPQQTKAPVKEASQSEKAAVQKPTAPSVAPATKPVVKKPVVKPGKEGVFGPGEWGVRQGKPNRVAKVNKEGVYGPGGWNVKPGDTSVVKANKDAIYGPGGWNVRQKAATRKPVQPDPLLKKSGKGAKKGKDQK